MQVLLKSEEKKYLPQIRRQYVLVLGKEQLRFIGNLSGVVQDREDCVITAWSESKPGATYMLAG